MISLFVETGIQYVDLDAPLNFQDPAASEPYGFQISADGHVSPLADGADEFGDAAAGAGSAQTIYCTAFDALDIFSRQWIPIPYHTTNPFWARAFLEPGMAAEGQIYQAVLACDTHSRPRSHDDKLGLLRDRGSGEIGYTFSVNAELEAFWTSTEVESMVYSAWRAWLRRTRPDVDPEDTDSLALEETAPGALAKLRALVRYLAGALPPVKVGMGSENEPIDAHLVVDLGNCRTCGIIVETPRGEGPFFASLEMRSHELPCRRTQGPFESYMQFVRPGFGQAGGDVGDGRFEGNSLIRLGDEALEASAFGGVSGALTGMSSPKRYLWDDTARPTDWCFVAEGRHGTCAPIAGHVLRHIDPDHPFRRPQVKLLANPPSPRYSRKTGIIFALLEILEQAFAQMNCVSHRRNMPVQGGENRRRVFRSLVLVHPSGMTPVERKELAEGAARAVDIWYDGYRDPDAFRRGEPPALPAPPNQPKPIIRLDCDEATAVQLCYLYGEVQSRFQGDAEGYLQVTGSLRDGKHTLRLASLDVGGGTTDLVISEYSAVPGAIGFTCLSHKPLFRDGIKLGGDDVGRAALTDVVFRDIIRQLDIRPKPWERTFSQTQGAVDPEWERIRRQLVSHVWVPLVRYFWGRTERRLPEERVTLRQVLRETHYPADLLGELNEHLRKLTDGRVADITTVELVLNPADFNIAARKVLSRPLYNFCDIIAQFDCDVLIVAGRAAGLPELMNMLVEYCPLPPARITSLQGYPVEGSWFPFARDGIIADAKSCVVVGAAMHFIATRKGGHFVLQSEGDWPNAVIIGVAEPLRRMIPDRNVLFRPDSAELVSGEVLFAGNLWLGVRNIDDETAYANALYQVTWQPEVERRIRDGQMVGPQVSLRFARRRDDPFSVTIHSAQGRMGTGRPVNRDHIALKVHTTYTDDYWLDTGCFYD